MDSPNKLMLIYQLARSENQASLTYIQCALRPKTLMYKIVRNPRLPAQNSEDLRWSGIVAVIAYLLFAIGLWNQPFVGFEMRFALLPHLKAA